MGKKVFKQIRVTGCSSKNYGDAIEAAIEKASESVNNLSWFEVTAMRGSIEDGKPSEWQATVDIGFKVESGSD